MEGKGNDGCKKNSISIAERRAAKCGFNASNMNTAPFIVKTSIARNNQSPCFTIPSGISPSALLDSLIMLPNAQAQSSPTTGTLPIHGEGLLDSYKSESATDGDDEFRHVTGTNKLASDELEYPRDWQEFMSGQDYSNDHDVPLAETTQAVLSTQVTSPTKCAMNVISSSTRQNDQNGKVKSTQLLNESEKLSHKKLGGEVAKYSEDGFYWRKYGQKHVKGSEYPRSYYKCTNANCPVRKKVERFHNGIIAEIEYKGFHNHPKPQPFKKPVGGEASEMNADDNESCSKTKEGSSDCRSGATDGIIIPSTSFLNEFSNPISETMEGQEYTLARQDSDAHEIEASSESISINDDDVDNCESEPLKRKREGFSNETAIQRSTREPKVVIQVESDIDILDDGYRWRKYGQKVVKGNPNPRSYYKCTTPGCLVRKHVERAADDIKSVITTYEGKHNHEVPSSKTSSSLPAVSEAGNSLSSSVVNGAITIPMPSSKPAEHMTCKGGKQFQDISSLYLDRKPIFNNYHDFVRRSNLQPAATNYPSELINFGSPSPSSSSSSSVYPLPFPPPFHPPITNYGSLINQIIKTSASSNDDMYPLLPECSISMEPSQINQIPNGMQLQAAGNFHFSSYAPRPNLPPGNMKLENAMPEL